MDNFQVKNILIDVPRLDSSQLAVTASPTSPSAKGVTVFETNLWKEWEASLKTSDPPKILNVPLTNGTETIAIIPTLDDRTKTFPNQIALAVNNYNLLVKALDFLKEKYPELTMGIMSLFNEIEKEKKKLKKGSK
jgi:hypothetical protein